MTAQATDSLTRTATATSSSTYNTSGTLLGGAGGECGDPFHRCERRVLGQPGKTVTLTLLRLCTAACSGRSPRSPTTGARPPAVPARTALSSAAVRGRPGLSRGPAQALMDGSYFVAAVARHRHPSSNAGNLCEHEGRRRPDSSQRSHPQRERNFAMKRLRSATSPPATKSRSLFSLRPVVALALTFGTVAVVSGVAATPALAAASSSSEYHQLQRFHCELWCIQLAGPAGDDDIHHEPDRRGWRRREWGPRRQQHQRRRQLRRLHSGQHDHSCRGRFPPT